MQGGDEETDGICILSFDNGGPGTYSQLLILKEYSSRLSSDLEIEEDSVYLADHFDLIGGVGFGGMVAFMLGHLGMNVNQAIDALLEVTEIISFDDSEDNIDKERNSNLLIEFLENALKARDIAPDTKMNDAGFSSKRSKVVLFAAASTNITHPHLFRTYSSRGSVLNPTIVEALCATMAVQTHFLPVKIGSRRTQESFIGSAPGANNPTRLLLEEASKIFGKDRRVAQIISLGCGLPRVLSVNSSNTVEVDRLLNEMAINCEMVANELSTRLFYIDAYLRLNVNRGMEPFKMKEWDGLGAIATHTAVYLASTTVSEPINNSLRHLQARTGSVTLGQLNHSSSIKSMAKKAPPVSPYFVLREKPWKAMVEHLVISASSRQKIFPITGMGGCGKTQLVSYFLQEYPTLYTQMIYVDASSSSSIKADFQVWIRTLGDGHECDAWEDAVRTLNSVPNGEQWVLILDNADDPSLNINSFLPRDINITILITSRNQNVGSLSTTTHLELGEMMTDEALSAMLQAARRHLPLPDEEMESAQALLNGLGCLAVGLVQAGTYCRQLSSTIGEVSRPYTFTQYLRLFRSHRADLMTRVEPTALDNYQHGVYTTLDLSYKALTQECRDFLHIVSLFHYTDIPLAAFAQAAGNAFQDPYDYHPRDNIHEGTILKLKNLLWKDMEWNELHLQGIIQTLRSFSLVTASSMNDSLFLQLHPLIQAWCRDMNSMVSRSYRAMAIQVLTSCGSNNIELNRFLLPHIIDILSQVDLQSIHINSLMEFGQVTKQQGHYHKAGGIFEAALKLIKGSTQASFINTLQVLSSLADSYWCEGRWMESEKLNMEVLEERKRVLGIDHLDTIDAAANLASTYYSQGRWTESEQLDVEVLKQRRRILGIQHPHTIDAAANLASTYHSQGRWTESEKLEVEVFEQRKQVLGMENPETIFAASNLAATYHAQGRWIESEKLHAEVLRQRRRILGTEHPDTLLATANLASIYHSQGRWVESEKLELEVLEQRRRILGIEHPETITAAANLASTYRSQKRWKECERLEVEVLEQRRRILGVEHPDTTRAAGNLAATYQSQGRWKESEKLELEVLEQRRRALGIEHPDTIGAAANLASTYHSQGRWMESEKLNVEVLEQRRRILGTQHPDTIIAAANLAATYRSQGRWIESEQLKVEILEQRRRVLGIEHPDTIDAAANLAAIYHSQGRWTESEELDVVVFERRKQLLGMEHPDTIDAAANLAATYYSQGRWNESESLEVEVLEQRRRILGLEHPDTIDAAADLAATYHSQGRWTESERLDVEVLEQRRQILGMEHPDTISASANLASTYRSQKRWKECEMLEAEVLEQRRKILGMEHPDTIDAAANLAATYGAQDRWREAATLLAPAARLSIMCRGQQHPYTQEVIRSLMSVYGKLGKTSEAEGMKRLLIPDVSSPAKLLYAGTNITQI